MLQDEIWEKIVIFLLIISTSIYNAYYGAVVFIIAIIYIYISPFQKDEPHSFSDVEYALMRTHPPPNTDFLDGIDIIYWINLDRSPDRRKYMETLFTNPVFRNIPNERIKASDGKLPATVYEKLRLQYKQKNDYEYACLLSHLETVHKFSQTNHPIALIAEDDITLDFQKYWRKSVREIVAQAPANWEIIQLCYICVHANPLQFDLYEPNMRNKCVSAAAYVIKNSAAKKIMTTIYVGGKYTIDPTINHHADCFLFAKLKTYTYKFPLFMYKKQNTSLLHPEDLAEHEYSRRKIEDMYAMLE